MFTIEQRDIPEQTVLTEQRSVRAGELVGFLNGAHERLTRSAQEHGGAAGPWFVIYNGRVGEDAPVPVEVCVPIAGAAPAGVATRTEPAHREAYVRLRKEQVAFPEIQDVYRAIDAWVRSEGKAFAAEPREVYFADFDTAAPDDEVCDVAFPIGG
jgi:hypothetical protein